jgi:hypothetical protein
MYAPLVNHPKANIDSLVVPEKVRFLTDRQKHIAIRRVSLEKESEQTETPTFLQSIKMLWDWKIGC